MNSSERTQDDCTESPNDNEDPMCVDGVSPSRMDSSSSSTSSSGQLTVDAVHPFFTSYRNIQTFYCEQCKEEFETSPKSLKLHFMTKKHKPISSCTYCHLPVYEYIHNGNHQIYHRCEEELPSTHVDSNDNDVSGRPNLLSSPTSGVSSSNVSHSNTTDSSISDVSTDNTSV